MNVNGTVGSIVANGTFQQRLREQLFRESLGEELGCAKGNHHFQLVVRHGRDNEVYALIIIGASPPEDQAQCRQHLLIRTNVRHTLSEYRSDGHINFYHNNNLNPQNLADTYFILWRNRICDLKAVARVSLGLNADASLATSSTVARAVHKLGFTYVHFVENPLEGQEIIRLTETTGQERDGLRYGRSGEGKNHRRLRKWVKRNPDEVVRGLRNVRTKTEVPLLSGDRVDVVYCAEGTIIAIEVKSRDSNKDDLLRGIYQCVKYGAVLNAENLENVVQVSTLLVTESQLPEDYRELAERLNVEHCVVEIPR